MKGAPTRDANSIRGGVDFCHPVPINIDRDQVSPKVAASHRRCL